MLQSASRGVGVSAPGGGSAPRGGVPGLGGVCSWGVPGPGGAWSGGMPGPGGCLLQRGVGIPACTEADTPPPLWTDTRL